MKNTIKKYETDLLKYKHDLFDTTYYVSGTRLADGSLKADKLTNQDLVKICHNSMIRRGVFGEGSLDKIKYDEKKAQFLFYSESTKYYPSFPVITTDFDRPIIPADIDNPALVKKFYPTKFRNIVAFGDSLSDQGNVHRRMSFFKNIGLNFPSEPYWGGRFTDSLNWLDDMKSNIGVSVFNWAFASAETSNIVKENIALSFEEQVDDYIHSKGMYPGLVEPYIYGGYGTPNDFNHTLFSVLIGGNNYIHVMGFDVPSGEIKYEIHTSQWGPTTIVLDKEFVSHTISDIQIGIDKLVAIGARYFIVGYLPDMSEVPQESVASIQKTKGVKKEIAIAIHNRMGIVIQNHNAQLKTMLTKKYAGKGLTFITVDVAKLVKTIQKNPKQFQSNSKVPFNITEPCYDNFMSVKQLLATLGIPSLSSLFKVVGTNTDLFMSNFYVKDPSTFLCSNPQDYLFWDTIHPTSKVHKIIAKELSDYLKLNYAR